MPTFFAHYAFPVHGICLSHFFTFLFLSNMKSEEEEDETEADECPMTPIQIEDTNIDTKQNDVSQELKNVLSKYL